MPTIRRRDLLIIVAAGGAIGTIARYELGQAIRPSTHGFPWSTFLANQTGAFALGLFLTMVAATTARGLRMRAFIAVGFLGAYTTFSSFTVETALLVKAHHGALALVYFSSTIAVGLTVAWLGIGSGRRLSAARA